MIFTAEPDLGCIFLKNQIKNDKYKEHLIIDIVFQ